MIKFSSSRLFKTLLVSAFSSFSLAGFALAAEDVVGLVRENCSGYSNCYTSLSAWEAAYGGVSFGTCTVGNLVCAGKNAVAQIDGTWTNPDTTPVLINGWTTGTGNYIRIYTAPAARHDGKWNSTAYRLQSSDTPIEINEENVRLDGLQVFMNDTSFAQWNRGILANLGTSASDIRISNSLVRSNGNIGNNTGGIWFETTGPGSKFYIYNTAIYGFKTNGDYAAGVRSVDANWTGYMYNVTSNYNDYGFRNNGGTFNIKNSYAGGNTHASYNGAASLVRAASSDGTGSVGYTSVAYSTSAGAAFNSVALGSEDFRIKSNSALKDAGVDTSTEAAPLNFTTDIEGQARSAPWDIGADEAGSAQADATPPSTPASLAAVAVSSSQINLSWPASTDNVAVVGYRIYRDGVQIATPTSTSYSSVGLAANTLYSYGVSAFDTANNESGQASASTRTWAGPDTVAPSTPTAFTAVAVSTSQINLSWTASTDNVGVAKYWLFRGGVQIATVTAATSYSNTGLAAATLYNYTLQALDAAGNKSGFASVSTQTLSAPDATAPTVQIQSPSNGAAVSGVLSVSGTAQDNVALSKVEVSVDGGAYSLASGLANWTFSVNTALLSNGNHTLAARATDTNNNTANHSITVSASNVPTSDKKIHVQGKFTDAGGNAVSGPKVITFRLYAVSTAPIASKIWEDTIGVNLSNGLFNVTLGQNASLDAIAFDKPLYLGFQVAGEASEMVPRQVLGASAYALGSVGNFNAAKSVLVGDKVGIGTSAPTEKLQVEGNAVISGTIRGATYGFGGSYAVDSCGTDSIANSFTGAASCPAGFSSALAARYKSASGSTSCTSQFYVCVK